jgi:hypothetical protein
MSDTPIADSLTNTSDVTHLLNLPPDPPEDQRTVLNIPLSPVQPAPKVQATEVPKQVAPYVTVDANNIPHVTIPLTKKTKANIGTGVAVVTTAGVLAAQLLPPESGVVGWIQVGIGVIGLVATYLGIVLPTNLPIKIKK